MFVNYTYRKGDPKKTGSVLFCWLLFFFFLYCHLRSGRCSSSRAHVIVCSGQWRGKNDQYSAGIRWKENVCIFNYFRAESEAPQQTTLHISTWGQRTVMVIEKTIKCRCCTKTILSFDSISHLTRARFSDCISSTLQWFVSLLVPTTIHRNNPKLRSFF